MKVFFIVVISRIGILKKMHLLKVCSFVFWMSYEY